MTKDPTKIFRKEAEEYRLYRHLGRVPLPRPRWVRWMAAAPLVAAAGVAAAAHGYRFQTQEPVRLVETGGTWRLEAPAATCFPAGSVSLQDERGERVQAVVQGPPAPCGTGAEGGCLSYALSPLPERTGAGPWTMDSGPRSLRGCES
jgi:hypothetical protein